ncbi:MAG: hypothetical protein A3G33_08150 [Omnitrophica bacterium RIFCSPLOWO2_12_FULL_44_17]|uniref:Uncharacterized protein n=1 Tax=Candidatus Danuiimicrobium aquiferis TaxID=1801832 RepID=A0A1G1KXY9_9BACT|nr:MAG: hypothetical protein A3B72_05850 [Omnitrophica bacterium RIFCSPHIGHO2_02_FULL_45_28]OGW89756.1 MAG: hypothetical protein A3E74_06315 [Omnitrophica bacterium RIFCSPHIGHO2_12_FULL_44_12]OGW97774.1 MAG: hypothetical protein A3G33_08150 [Omnitrophica bacterium RIFCSPLOWO2_12_FULL_44_17]
MKIDRIAKRFGSPLRMTIVSVPADQDRIQSIAESFVSLAGSVLKRSVGIVDLCKGDFSNDAREVDGGGAIEVLPPAVVGSLVAFGAASTIERK